MQKVLVRSALLVAAVTILPILAASAQEERRPSIVIPSPLGNPPPPGEATAKEPIVNLGDGGLTVWVENWPLDWVLDEVSRNARVAIVRAPGVGGKRISEQFRDLPVDEGLRRVLRDYDAFFFYGVEKEAHASLRAVWVYPKGRGRSFAPVPAEAWASTGELRGEAIANSDPAGRARAIEALIERSGNQALDVVLTALQDSDEKVRTSALYGSLESGVGIPPDRLAQLALMDPSPNIRFLALESLARDRKARATINVGAIAAQALRDPSPHVRSKAKEILNRPEPSGQSQSQPKDR